jgi:predicted transcriptional regulator
MKAADIMTANVVTIDRWMSIAEAARVMQWNNVRALIVNRDSEEDAYGIITQTDIVRATADAKNSETTYVAEVMTKPCIVVNPDLAVKHIIKLFAKAKIHFAPVIQGKLLGILSVTDILTKTNDLSLIEDKLTLPKIENFTEFYPNTSQESKEESNDDYIYENWCSG